MGTGGFCSQQYHYCSVKMVRTTYAQSSHSEETTVCEGNNVHKQQPQITASSNLIYIVLGMLVLIYTSFLQQTTINFRGSNPQDYYMSNSQACEHTGFLNCEGKKKKKTLSSTSDICFCHIRCRTNISRSTIIQTFMQRQWKSYCENKNVSAFVLRVESWYAHVIT